MQLFWEILAYGCWKSHERVIAVGEKDDVLDIVEDFGREFDLDLPEDM